MSFSGNLILKHTQMSKPSRNHQRTFWLVFCPIFVVTSFVPVLPLYKGDILLWVVPVWAIYASLLMAPEWLLFSVPVVYTHAAASYLVARRLATIGQNPIRLSILPALSVLAAGISVVVAFPGIGFSMFFLACLLTVTVASFRNWDSVAGLPMPKMNRTIRTASAIICGVMIVFGIPIALSRVAG